MTLPEAPFDDPALTPAGERLLDAASELFYRRGIRAVGVDLVAETAGTTKKTLYDRFGSKDELVALYLRRRARRWQAFLFPYVRGSGPDGVLAVFDALAAWLREQGRGCAFVNAYAEVGGTGHPAESVIRAEKDWMRRRVRRARRRRLTGRRAAPAVRGSHGRAHRRAAGRTPSRPPVRLRCA